MDSGVTMRRDDNVKSARLPPDQRFFRAFRNVGAIGDDSLPAGNACESDPVRRSESEFHPTTLSRPALLWPIHFLPNEIFGRDVTNGLAAARVEIVRITTKAVGSERCNPRRRLHLCKGSDGVEAIHSML